jgi:hypothetical protein
MIQLFRFILDWYFGIIQQLWLQRLIWKPLFGPRAYDVTRLVVKLIINFRSVDTKLTEMVPDHIFVVLFLDHLDILHFMNSSDHS